MQEVDIYSPKYCQDWQEKSLYDLAIWKNGLAFKDINFSNKGKPVIKIAELKNGITAQTKFTKDIFEDAVHITKGDMVFSWSGNPQTSIDVFYYNLEDGWLNQHIFKITTKEEVLKNYFFYTLKYLKPNFKMIAANKQTTGLGHVTINDLKKIKIKLPPLAEQKRIASILSSLDDKIELNNKTNRILEELAQTIFEEWFINFNFPNEDGKPYKKSGGEMIGSELGKIPKGWKVGTIGDLISNLFNGDWGKDTNKEKYTEEVICVRGADIGDISKGFDGNPVRRFILEKNLKSKKLLAGDIVIECSGGSPTQSTGRCIFVTENLLSAYDKPLICTNFCKVIKIKEKEYRGYAYNLLWYLYNTRLFFLFENGTTGIKNLDVNNLFKRHMIAIPDINVSSEYNKIFLSLIDLMHANKKENEKLSGIRDSLLPKLMSGEIRV